MAVTFSYAERHICSLFSVGSQFKYKGTTYTVKFVGKPTCSHGEPKTDVYVNAASSSKVMTTASSGGLRIALKGL